MCRYTISYGAIGIIFLISGLSIPWKTLVDNITKWRLHLVVQVTSYLVVALNIESDLDILVSCVRICLRYCGVRNR